MPPGKLAALAPAAPSTSAVLRKGARPCEIAGPLCVSMTSLDPPDPAPQPPLHGAVLTLDTPSTGAATTGPGIETSGDGILGKITGAKPGPTLIVLAGLHGNEPSGVLGARALAQQVLELERGALVMIEGNRPALEAGVRFLKQDLNRRWCREELERIEHALAQNDPGESICPEDKERVRIWKAIREAVGAATGRVFLLDLHSTSGESPPFLNVGDALATRDFADCIDVPAVLGLDESLVGTMLQLVEEKGLASLVFEAGQHYDPAAADNAEAAIWAALGYLRVLTPSQAGPVKEAHLTLRKATRDEHRIFEVVERYELPDASQFTMDEGWASFKKVHAGQRLAMHNGQEVISKRDGYLLMPLYQPQG